jgi:hypothetical protein
MLIRSFPTFARAPDGAAGGAGTAAETTPATTTTAPTTTTEQDPAGGGASLFDLADDAPKTDADGKPQRPDWLPENFWDAEKGAPRLEPLAKSWRDMRATVSRGEHKPPETAEAYTLPEVEGLPAGVIGGEKDTLWPEVRSAAHAAGVTQKQLAAIAQPFLAAVAAQMKAAGTTPADPEAERQAMRRAGETELAKLGPNGAAMVRNVGGWLAGLETRGMFSKDEVQALRGISNAEGIRALGKLAELAGEKPIPVEAMQNDTATQADAQRMLVEGYAKGDVAMQDKARDMLKRMADINQLLDPRSR